MSGLHLGWRLPKGTDSKLRLQKRGHGSLVRVGYGSPAAVRGYHRLGFIPVHVSSIRDLASVDPKKEGIIIHSTVGKRLHVEIIKQATAKKITILNIKDPAKYIQEVSEQLKKRKEEKAKRQTEQTKKKKELEQKAAKKKEEEKKEGIEEAIADEEKKKEEKKEMDNQLIHTS